MITRDGAQNGAPNVFLEGDSEHVFLALAFILEAVYNIKPSLTADGVASVKQRQTAAAAGNGNAQQQQQQQQHADSSKSSDQFQQQSNGQKQSAKGRNSPTAGAAGAVAVSTTAESDSKEGATHDKQEPSSTTGESSSVVIIDKTPTQDTILIPSDKVTTPLKHCWANTLATIEQVVVHCSIVCLQTCSTRLYRSCNRIVCKLTPCINCVKLSHATSHSIV
jgi:hypothetical protein